MDNADKYYDIGIVGGGLAGLSTSILLARAGYRVILFEKEVYPFHRVCGEYISLESWDFLISLGLRVDTLDLPIIKNLLLTSPDGTRLEQKLPLGGFGISRYTIDYALAKIARSIDVEIMDGTRVLDIIFDGGSFRVSTNNTTITCKVCCGTFGKRSNLDVKWKRKFIQQKPNTLNNLIGVKYHAVIDHPKDTIGLHNFNNGYCGISPLESDKFCICYLTSARNLQMAGNDLKQMERNVLFKNPFIKDIFSKSEFLFVAPLTISQISFEKKEQVENGVLMIGDAAGMITPLCGNGMSMALHASRIACKWIIKFFEGEIARNEMENMYTNEWKSEFASRLRTGRMIQSLFGKEWITNSMVHVLRYFPAVVSSIIRHTHGKK